MQHSYIYAPWSPATVAHSLNNFTKSNLPILDIEMTSKCLHGACVYCDSSVNSSRSDELTFENLRSFVDKAKEVGLNWVFICGLGEPTDDHKFEHFIEYLFRSNIQLSMFSNGINYNRTFVKVLRECNVNLIVKLDSLNELNFDKLLGRNNTARKIYKSIDMLLEEGYARENGSLTDLAVSIVPTTLNYHDIPSVVKFCRANNIFPSIGQLEYSGKAIARYRDLSLTNDQLLFLKNEIDNILGYSYSKPLCPSTIASLHVNHMGSVIVDRMTGLSCPWFKLEEPDYYVLGDIRKTDISELLRRLFDYRRNRRIDIEGLIKNYSNTVFGGCGGTITSILSSYSSTLVGQ